MHGITVYLGLGSNVGEREKIIGEACDRLAKVLEPLDRASLYETAPQEVIDQPRFINTVVRGHTELPPLELLDVVHAIERDLGRDRANERVKGPRTIDIDILLYGDSVLRTPELTLPHSAIANRKFVLLPLLELAPRLVDPAASIPYEQYLRRLPPQGIYYFQAKRYIHET